MQTNHSQFKQNKQTTNQLNGEIDCFSNLIGECPPTRGNPITVRIDSRVLVSIFSRISLLASRYWLCCQIWCMLISHALDILECACWTRPEARACILNSAPTNKVNNQNIEWANEMANRKFDLTGMPLLVNQARPSSIIMQSTMKCILKQYPNMILHIGISSV